MAMKSGFGRFFAVVAIAFAMVVSSLVLSGTVMAADTAKEKPVDLKAVQTDKKTSASETGIAKTGEKAVVENDTTSLLISGSRKFMEGAEMVKNKKDKAVAEKMMLEGHKIMAESETAWAKTGKELSSAQKNVSEGHAKMMKGYSIVKSDKDTDQGIQMITDGYKKFNEGLKALQATKNGKDTKSDKK